MLSALRNHVAGVASFMVCLLVMALPAQSQSSSDHLSSAVAAPALIAANPEYAASSAPVPAPADKNTTPRPSPAFSALQVSFATLQVMDVVTTMRAMETGHLEANPLMRDVAGHPLAFAAAKTGAAAATILLTRKVAKNNRPAAIAIMVALNSAYSVIVARNLHVAGARP